MSSSMTKTSYHTGTARQAFQMESDINVMDVTLKTYGCNIEFW